MLSWETAWKSSLSCSRKRRDFRRRVTDRGGGVYKSPSPSPEAPPLSFLSTEEEEDMAEEASGSSRRPRPRRRRRPAPWGKAAAASAALAALIVVSALVEEVGLISLGIWEKPFCFDCKSRMSMRARHQWFIHASSPIPAGDRPPGSRTLVILEGQVSVQACLHSFEEKPSLFSLPPILQNSIRHMFSVQNALFSFFHFSACTRSQLGPPAQERFRPGLFFRSRLLLLPLLARRRRRHAVPIGPRDARVQVQGQEGPGQAH